MKEHDNELAGSMKILGVLLCGGASRRMGSDKGLLAMPGQSELTWSEKGLSTLRRAGLEVVLSVNASQQTRYAKILPAESLILDSAAIGGPLCGILSVHRARPRESLMVLAVDMIRMPESTVNLLLNAYRATSDHEACAFRVNGRLEPLCAVYGPELLKRAGTRTSPTALLAAGRTLIIERDEKPGEFANPNSPDEIRDYFG